MILTDGQIRQAIADGEIEISPFEESQLEPATYDIRVGAQGGTTTSKKLVDISKNGYLQVAPGDFAVIVAHEFISLNSQHAARFGLRSKYARKGLIATTGPQIDPGFKGRLIVGLTNLTPRPVTLPYKDDLLSIEFHRLEVPVENPYDGPFQGKMELGADEIEVITDSEGMALSEVLTTLRSLSTNVGELAKDMHSMTSEFKAIKWIVPLIIAVALGIMALI